MSPEEKSELYDRLAEAVETPLSTADEVIEYLRPSNKRWLAMNSAWMFRGHGVAEWKLEPSAWRRPLSSMLSGFQADAEEFFDTWWRGQSAPGEPILPYSTDDASTIRKECIVAAATELLAVRTFVDISDDVSHNFVEHVSSPPDRWDKLFGAPSILRILALPFAAIAIAQHHRVPTRLLDFTRHSLIGLYFACEDVMDHERFIDPAARSCVWAVDSRRYEQSRQAFFRLDVPRHKSQYIAAQCGVFGWASFIGPSQLPWSPDHYWHLFHQQLFPKAWKEGLPTDPPIRKISFPANLAPELLHMLAAERVTRAHIMPTLDNVVETMKMQRRVRAHLVDKA